ncbi:DEAD/DEAH box helicase family protein [Lacrimispora sp. 210928-DFI.3.58]|uniref:DEAD/DEAH box helicase family protein n=1 Tax=Lacrimispora sp. 210928-DFI.3.58 TaxID=2883214 RepID=UPI001D08FB13|nr:DEAD/DEAH box helicase family protein [Lacrimispora sp. 210928-DFI.3.58]MCB7320877.1 DEAD/DEAH box helicase family protein [Lacrimispora sp. 210928-DFI.3.58]
MGNGEGVTAGAGNPAFPDKYSVSYMWEDILTKDTVLDLISKFVFVEVKETEDEQTGKIKRSENLIFPRYHQLDVIRKLLADVHENRTAQNYLIQHSAGSGKTNSIAWLAHRLTSLHDAENKIIFDNIIIVTDRVVVDRQLQKAIMGMEHKAGLIRVMDDKCNSTDLAIALNSNTKIIATTIQKFPFIVDSVKNLKNKHFAVIIDEAHSSTAGKDMAAVTMALGSGGQEVDADVEDMISSEIKRNGKQANVSIFAFTATPKPTTIQLFGRLNTKGQKEAFHVYSMKQAIEEGFILDVLQNYTEYLTFYQINKEIEDDPRCKTNEAKRQIARFVELHDTNIAQRVEVIVEHFRTTIMQELGGQAKAMVITASRQGAVKYRQAFEDYTKKKGYDDIKALVAFSGKVKLPDDDKEYTESAMNGFPEERLPKEFDSEDYQVLLVANKYQTGFDQPKLCAMYVLKKLKGVNAVQTLSRLNRICPPYDKKTFVLDFVNTYDEIKAAFAPYYTTTLLANSVTPNAVYDLEAKIDAYAILDPADIEAANDILYIQKVTGKQKQRLTFFLQKSKKLLEHYEYETQRQSVADMRSFVRFYEFLLQVSSFEDTELHKKYNYVAYLLAYINIKHPGGGFNLDEKIRASNFVQKKGEEHKKSDLVADPVVKLPTAEHFGLTEDKEKRLSEIIDEINSRTGKNYDNDVVVKAMLQIRDILMKSEKLKISAKNNTQKDFEFSYFDDIDDALIEGLSQNQDFFSLLLNNDEIKRQVLGIFSDEIYKSLRNA